MVTRFLLVAAGSALLGTGLNRPPPALVTRAQANIQAGVGPGFAIPPRESKETGAAYAPAAPEGMPFKPRVDRSARTGSPGIDGAMATDDADPLRLGTRSAIGRRANPRPGDAAPAGPLAVAAVTCPVGEIVIGTPVDGSLGDGQCWLPQVVGGDNASQAEQYAVTIATRGRLTVTVPRGDFDPYVAVLDDQSFFLGEDASTGDSVEVDIVVPAGTYIVVVGAAPGAPDTGSYRIDTSFTPEIAPSPCPAGAPLALTGTADGSLSTADCRLFDVLPGVFRDPYARYYPLTIAEAGALTVVASSPDFEPVVVLVDAANNALAADGGADNGGPANLTFHLPAGQYRVAMTASHPAPGRFSLTTSFAPHGGRCAAEDVDPTFDRTGSLAPSDCALAYAEAGSFNQSPADYYRVVIAQRSQGILVLTSDAFTPVLRLLDINGKVVDRVFQAMPGTSSLRITISFLPGEYTLVVSGRPTDLGQAAGSYRIQTSFATPGEPCVVGTIPPTGSADGELALSDCTLYDVGSVGAANARAGNRVRQYRVTIAGYGLLSVDMTSADFDTRLYGYNAAMTGMAVHSDPDSRASGLELVVYPGTYVLVATSDTRGEGRYRISTRFDPRPIPADCPIKPLAINGDLDGELTATTCRGFDIVPGYPVQEYTDRYRLTVTQRGVLTVEQSSDDIDGFLELYQAGTYELLALNDDFDPESSLNAKIEITLLPGEYILHATEVGVVPGPYHLTTTFDPQPANPCPTAALQPDGRVNGMLAEADCQFIDLPAGIQLTVPVDTYRLHVPQFGRLTIQLASLRFDPYLGLFDPRWEVLAINDDRSATNLDSQLVLDVPPGIYLVIATTADDAVGAYQLDTAFQPAAVAAMPTPTPTPSVERTPTVPPTPTRTPTGQVPRWHVFAPFTAKQFP